MNASEVIAGFATNPFLTEYSQGAIVNFTRRVAKVLAPIVPVPDLTAHYKIHNKDRRLILPDTVRRIGGKATSVSIDVLDGTTTCQVHSLDYVLSGAPVAIEYFLADAFDFLLGIASQVMEQETITKAFAAAGNGSASVWGSDVDPVKEIDDQILALILAAKCDAVAVIFGTGAWSLFKHHPLVLARIKGGDLSWQSMPNLFHAGAEFLPSYSLYDSAPNAAEEVIDWIFPADSVLIIASSPKPNRRDASFMKTFTKLSKGFDFVPTKDGRDILTKFDWYNDIKVTNSAGVIRLNASLS
ncbi:MAG: hypothetical protein P4L99_04940 [Chthoniobacter sp.]|nr:hypothetical protein [Chthoniobacter sp.]